MNLWATPKRAIVVSVLVILMLLAVTAADLWVGGWVGNVCAALTLSFVPLHVWIIWRWVRIRNLQTRGWR